MYSERIENFLDFLREAAADYNYAVENEHAANAQTQDILHAVEFGEYAQDELTKLMKTLHNVRQERREAKDCRIKLQSVVEWAGSNRDTIKSLEKLLGEVRKAEKSTENRFYMHKTDIVEKTLSEKNSPEC